MDVIAYNKALLDQIVNDLFTKGYFEESEEFSNGTGRDIKIPGVTLRKIARMAAKQHKRPFVRVYTDYEWTFVGDGKGKYGWNKGYNRRFKSIQIMVPRKRYLYPLINPLSLTDYKIERRCTFWLASITHEDFAREYLSMFSTREEFRKALRLPPLVTEPLRIAA